MAKGQFKRSPEMYNSRRGANHHNWKGGEYTDKDGYIMVRLNKNDPYYALVRGNGYVSKHRYLMSQKLGRIVSKAEIVHHIDGNKQNNSIDNLVLLKDSSIHRLIDKQLLYIRELEMRLSKYEPLYGRVNV